jgi:EpsI family protein
MLGNILKFAEPPNVPGFELDEIDLYLDGGSHHDESIDDRFLEVLGTNEVIFRRYGDEHPVWLFMGYFDKQREGSQVHSPRHCYPGSGWDISEDSEINAPWGGDKIRSLVISDGMSNRLVYYWFQVPEKILSGVLDLKIHLTKNAIIRRSQEVVFVRISTMKDDNPDVAIERLREFAIEIHSGDS